ncbi:hypothetical protein HY497_01575 [Candidatus Woesearchaeota archaeon]|nr:hypothetical protein [Candidatus Woesearchaeota archaeon]
MASGSDAHIEAGVIRYKGLFDWEGLYYSIADWYKRYRFYLIEEMYKHKVPTPLGAEQELHWYGTLDLTEFVQFRIDTSFHLWDMTEVEVVKNGKKKLLTNARIEIKVEGTLTFDYQNKFEKNKLTRVLKALWLNYLYRREATTLWQDTLYYRMLGLVAHIKKYLDMQGKSHEYAGYLGEER